MNGSAPPLFLCRGCRIRFTLRPACPLPPKRLSTPRSARRLSTTDWGLLPGTPVSTRSGLTPAGTTQLPGRNMHRDYGPSSGLVPGPPTRLSITVSRDSLGHDDVAEPPPAVRALHALGGVRLLTGPAGSVPTFVMPVPVVPRACASRSSGAHLASTRSWNHVGPAPATTVRTGATSAERMHATQDPVDNADQVRCVGRCRATRSVVPSMRPATRGVAIAEPAAWSIRTCWSPVDESGTSGHPPCETWADTVILTVLLWMTPPDGAVS